MRLDRTGWIIKKRDYYLYDSYVIRTDDRHRVDAVGFVYLPTSRRLLVMNIMVVVFSLGSEWGANCSERRQPDRPEVSQKIKELLKLDIETYNKIEVPRVTRARSRTSKD